jgi:hypothetical protein
MKGLEAKGRRNQISGFFCTDHFLERVWKRKIEIERLADLLEEIPKDSPKGFCYIIPLAKRNKNHENVMIIKIKKDLLITVFFTKLETYIGTKSRDDFILSHSKYNC